MTKRLYLACLLACLATLHLISAATAAGIAFLPETTRGQVMSGPPSLELLTWELPEGLLIVDRRGPAGQVRLGESIEPRHADAEWFLVYRPHLARGRGAAADPADFGHIHFAGQSAWVLEVPRVRLDDFLAAAFRLQYLDLSPLAAPASPKVAPSGAAPQRLEPELKAAYLDSLDLQAYSQIIREISGDLSFWYNGAWRTVTTRYYYSTGKNLAGGYLAGILTDYGYAVELDTFTFNSRICRNVVATKLGTTLPQQIVVVGGHYDSISGTPETLAPGAEDNASGSSLVMEIARVSADRQFDRTVQFVLFDAEEVGLVGSQHFVQEAVAEGRNIIAAITADMVSYYQSNYGVIIEGQPSWEWLMATMADNVAAHTEIAYRKDYTSYGSDHVPFQQAGIAAFLAIDWDWDKYPYYHRRDDNWSRIEATAGIGLQITRAAAGTLADVAGLQPPLMASPDTPMAPVYLAAYPNPFNPSTALTFSLAAASPLELSVFDLSGRKLVTPAAGSFAAGTHTVTWNGLDRAGRALPSGVYLSRVWTPAGSASVKLSLVR